jgi:hypothetical protein
MPGNRAADLLAGHLDGALAALWQQAAPPTPVPSGADEAGRSPAAVANAGGGLRMIIAKADVVVFEEIERVYQFVALDFVANYPRWSPEVVELEALSTGPVRLGYQARQGPR